MSSFVSIIVTSLTSPDAASRYQDYHDMVQQKETFITRRLHVATNCSHIQLISPTTEIYQIFYYACRTRPLSISHRRNSFYYRVLDINIGLFSLQQSPNGKYTVHNDKLSKTCCLDLDHYFSFISKFDFRAYYPT